MRICAMSFTLHSIVNLDLQWTVLSETECFCSFYPPHGNAMGLKFEKFKDLKVCTDIVQQIIEPVKRPKLPKHEKSLVDITEITIFYLLSVLTLRIMSNRRESDSNSRRCQFISTDCRFKSSANSKGQICQKRRSS